MLEDRAYMRDRPYEPRWSAVVILLFINLGVFVVQSIVETYSRFPVVDYFYLSVEGLKRGFIWQIITFQFLHGGMTHLIGNCIGIWFCGREVEETLGRKGFWIFYLVCGVAGGILQVIFALALPDIFGGPVLGASAGSLGLLAGFATLFPDRILTLLLFFIIPISLRGRTLLWISLGLAIFGIVVKEPGVAHAAHFGGIIAGILLIKKMTSGNSWTMPRLLKPRPVRAKAPKITPLRPRRDSFVDADDFIKKEVDPILDKISAHGLHSLTDREREILDRARKQMDKH